MSSARASKKKSPKKPATKTASRSASKVAAKTASSKVAGKTASRSNREPVKTAKRQVTLVSDNPLVDMCRDLAAIVEVHSLSELIVDTPDATLTLRRGGEGAPVMQTVAQAPVALAPPAAPAAAPGPASAAAAPAAEQPAAEADDGAHVVTSPFVGTFYRSPNPDSPPYVEIGQRVEKGQVLCIVEAMKLMNEIEADIAGVVQAVLVSNAEPVEYGQSLFKIAP